MDNEFKLENIQDIKRHIVDGELVPVQNTVYVNPNKITIKWYDYEGRLVDENHDGRVPAYMWQAHIDGIDPEFIRLIEYPPISYDITGDYLVKVVYDVYAGEVI